MIEEYYKELFKLLVANEHYNRSVRAYRLEHGEYPPAGILKKLKENAGI